MFALIVPLLLLGQADPEVIVFVEPQCPLVRLYAQRLADLATRFPQAQFRAVHLGEKAGDEELAALAGRLGFPLVQDDGSLARKLGATRSPEAFVLFAGKVVYSGRIDDQYAPGTNRSQPIRRDLEEALGDILAGRAVQVPRTVATGCRLSLPERVTTAEGVTFAEVAPILHQHCAGCHRPGQVGPFPLLTYGDAHHWRGMIREVVAERRMPPWHADPRYGRFANDRSLTNRERQKLLAWIDAGALRGSEVAPPPPPPPSDWQIRPDLVLTMPQPFAVPAEGVLDYQEFTLDPGLPGDTWVQAVQLRPGNPAVVHHINVYLRPRGGEADTVYLNELSDGYLAMAVPGNTVTAWPAGVAKVIPAGWQIVLSVHYQPNGMPQRDQSSIALELADPRQVRQQAATRVLLDDGLVIPPHQQKTVQQTWRLDQDYTLLALYPHMHLRGRSMRFEAIGADGQTEVLLDVPNYDFGWQHRYVLAEPLFLPRGTTLRATATFDNRAANPNNPDPAATVRAGKQSTDEMFQACFEVVRTHEIRLADQSGLNITAPIVAMLALLFVQHRNRNPPARHKLAPHRSPLAPSADCSG